MMAEIASAFGWTPSYMETFTHDEFIRWHRKASEKNIKDKKYLIEIVSLILGKSLSGG